MAGAPVAWAQSQAPIHPATPAAAPAAVPPAMPSRAANPPPPLPPVDPARLAAAQDVLLATHWKDSVVKILDGQKVRTMAYISRIAEHLAPGQVKPEDLAKFRADLLNTWLAALHPDDIVAKTAEAYARDYTVDEMEGIAAFFRSPAGQAFLTHEQDVASKSYGILSSSLQGAGAAAQAVVNQYVAAHPVSNPSRPGPYLPPGLHYTPPANAATPAPKPSVGPAPSTAPSAAAPAASTK